jgi:hypothetical protein
MLMFKAKTLVLAGDDDFQYNPEYKVLICKKYKQAIKGFEIHLEDAYGLKKKERRLLLNRYNSLFLVKLKDVYTLLSYKLPFEALRDLIFAF